MCILTIMSKSYLFKFKMMLMLMKLSYEGCMLSKEEIKVDMNEFVRVWKEKGNCVEKRA